MDRAISSLSLPPSLVTKLLENGFKTQQDLLGFRPVELSKEIGCTPTEALQILKGAKTPTSTQQENLIVPKISSDSNERKLFGTTSELELSGQSALRLLEKEVNKMLILTFSESIDKMLGGGIPLGKLTEFCGVPGIGKTQMGFQLAVNVSIPKSFGGVFGHCIYVDTEGSFMPERLVEVATELNSHLTELTENDETSGDAAVPTVEEILSHIWYFRVHDYVEQIALINTLGGFLNERPMVKLLVIDSIAFHFRHDFEDMGKRSRLLTAMAHKLMDLAERFEIAVVLMNQVTTRLDKGGATLVPALGESWGHSCSIRVMLYWQNNMRYAHLVKSPMNESKVVPYMVTPKGIRDAEISDQSYQ